jgi:hypothetical protein
VSDFPRGETIELSRNRPKSLGGVSRSRQLRQEAERKNSRQPRKITTSQQKEEHDNVM